MCKQLYKDYLYFHPSNTVIFSYSLEEFTLYMYVNRMVHSIFKSHPILALYRSLYISPKAVRLQGRCTMTQEDAVKIWHVFIILIDNITETLWDILWSMIIVSNSLDFLILTFMSFCLYTYTLLTST